MVALPHVAEGDILKERLIRAAALFRLAVVILVFVTVLLELTVGFLIPLVYGDRFRDSIMLAQILIVGGMAASLRRTLGDSFRGLGRPLLATCSEVVGWVVAVAGILWLTPLLGPVGAADAVTLSFVASLAVSIVLATFVAGITLSQLIVVRPHDVQAAFALAHELTRVVDLYRSKTQRTSPDVRVK
jgi:O-antigen/teichoic acid export membrane protein